MKSIASVIRCQVETRMVGENETSCVTGYARNLREVKGEFRTRETVG